MAYDPVEAQRREEQMMIWMQRQIERELENARQMALEYVRQHMQQVQFYTLPSPVQTAKSKKPERKPLAEEQIVGVVTGFRCWNAPMFEDVLRSQRGTKWTPKQRFEATCAASTCTGEKCSCGIYAYKDLALVEHEYGLAKANRKNVYGQVYLWGRVLDCERGYRAQFAYPKAFVDTGAVSRRMAEVYGVPLMECQP